MTARAAEVENELKPIELSINQDISNVPANRKSRWRARQSMYEIKQNKIKKIMKVGKVLDSKTKFKKTNKF